LFLITEDTGLSKLERTTGALQPIDTGDLDIGSYINTCPDGHVLFIAVPKGGGESRLFRVEGDGSGVTQLTTNGIARAPYCTPDSQKAYFSIRDKTSITLLSLWSVPLLGGTPQKELEVPSQGSIIVSRDTKLAAARTLQGLVSYLEIWDLNTHRLVRRLPRDVSSPWGGQPGFSPDGKAFVGGVTAKSGNALLYQPIDGSATHLLTDPTHDTLTDFAWSPSGSKLGVLQVRKSSDVVLITDLAGKQPH
jgi:Tol biopolymer transport system component